MIAKANRREKKVGAVLVIGGGIAGIQASLDLANSGQKVYLVERSPTIGGRMALLDKTFPTNDCSMCILSPKVVECGRHLNIELITFSEVSRLTGKPGHFQAHIRRYARYVDLKKCTGCGICLGKCPKRPRTPEAELHGHGAIYRPFPQALPNAPAIDREMCLFLTKGTCGACKKACPSGAIVFEDKDRDEVLDVGAVVVVPGFDEFRPEAIFDSGYSRFPDVVTSVEFERMLSASGPFGGHVVRPSDKKEPKRIAFLQCVGSRDLLCRSGYCSSVCCMYAVKEAFIAKEHMKDVATTVFFMDVRAFGKDFDKYCERAEKERGVRFIRGRVHSVESGKDGEMTLSYAPETGGVSVESFDLLVLSVGLQPTADLRRLAQNLDLKLNEHGFVWTPPNQPLETSRSGVFAAGVASGPKDIPETVVQASAAACEARRLLADVSDTLTQEREYPAERDVSAEALRIGVFVCHCGTNIGGVVKVPAVAEYARTLPNVAYAEENLYACSQDSQAHIQEMIKTHNLNRVVVASCSPRTHEPLFQETLRESGLNPYYFEMANIRDQCSWIHMNQPEEATTKAKDLVRMAVAKVAFSEPLQAAQLDVTHSALVVGGGLAGMTAALAIADQGLDVTLIEREKELGGNLRHLRHTFDEPDIPAYLSQLEGTVRKHKHISVLTRSTLEQIEGFVGSFESTVNIGGRKKKVSHGAVIVATGGAESHPTEYLYGKNKRVLTQLELEEKLARKNALSGVKSVVMIQCVGSREAGHQYCSRVCCNTAVKNAIRIKELSPGTDVCILYRDVRTYGFSEQYYQTARDKGVVFVRFTLDTKPVLQNGNGLTVTIRESIVDRDLDLHPDLLVLSSRIEPDAGNEILSQLLKVPMNEDKFFLEAHVKLRPVEFATEGVFVAGLAHNPKSMPETVAQAQAAAAKVVSIISKDKFDAEPTIAALNEDLCDGCGICVPVCEYNALEVIARPGGKKEEKIVRLNEAMCKGCGGCVAACPSGAMEQKGFKNVQILAMIRAALVETRNSKHEIRDKSE
jgi:heterodisulfide reductase subunit A